MADREMASGVGCVTRSCIVDPRHDIASIVIELHDAHLRSPIVLTHIVQPFCNISADEGATTVRAEGGEGPEAFVTSEETASGSRFILQPRQGVVSYRWTCKLSAGFVLSERDRLYLRSDPRWPKAFEGYAFRPYRVRFPCRKLRLRLSARAEPSAGEQGRSADDRRPFDDVVPIVLRREAAERGHGGWVRDLSKTLALTSEWDDKDKAVWAVLEVENPSADRRYAIGYRPPLGTRRAIGLPSSPREAPESPPGDGSRTALTEQERGLLADYVLKECRVTRTDARYVVEDPRVTRVNARPPLPQHLTSALFECLSTESPDEAPQLTILGQIWHEDSAQLLTCFGRFSLEQWGLAFRWGCGIAGHAMRFGEKFSYYERAKDETKTLIYLQKPAPTVCFTERPHWVICIPILTDTDTPPIGVLSLSIPGGVSGATKNLERLAEQQSTNSEGVREAFRRISTVTQYTFWSALAGYVANSDKHAYRGIGKLIEQCLAQWAEANGSTEVESVMGSSPVPIPRPPVRPPIRSGSNGIAHVRQLAPAALVIVAVAVILVVSKRVERPAQPNPTTAQVQGALLPPEALEDCRRQTARALSWIASLKPGERYLAPFTLAGVPLDIDKLHVVTASDIPDLICPDGTRANPRCTAKQWEPNGNCPREVLLR